jgi:hypothetical protein
MTGFRRFVTKILHMPQNNRKTAKKGDKQMNDRQLISFYQASERLGVSYWTLWRGAEAGFFKTVYVGARRLIPQGEIKHIEEYGFGGRKRRSRPAGAVQAGA